MRYSRKKRKGESDRRTPSPSPTSTHRTYGSRGTAHRVMKKACQCSPCPNNSGEKCRKKLGRCILCTGGCGQEIGSECCWLHDKHYCHKCAGGPKLQDPPVMDLAGLCQERASSKPAPEMPQDGKYRLRSAADDRSQGTRNKESGLDEMIVSTADIETLRARTTIRNLEIITKSRFDPTQYPPIAKRILGSHRNDATQTQLVKICGAFNDDRGCLYPCTNNNGQPSKQGDKAHVCDAIIPVMPQWVFAIPPPERITRGLVFRIKYKCCASTSHTRRDHLDHHDGVFETNSGSFVWLMDLSAGANRWAGVI
jgi:hypothetical protein